MPVFSGEFWIWQAMGTALGFFVLVYGIYYTAVRIGDGSEEGGEPAFFFSLGRDDILFC